MPDDSPTTADPTVGDVFATRLRRFRKERGLSVPALAERCSELGVSDLTVPSLTNLERPAAATRARRRVTVEEWLALAVALRVPPLALVAPAGDAERVVVTPGNPIPTGDFIDWVISDDSGLVVFGDNITSRQVSALALARRFHRCAVMLANLERFKGVDVGELVTEFLAVKAEILRRGEVVPALPTGKADVVDAVIEQYRPQQMPGVQELFSATATRMWATPPEGSGADG